MLGLCGTAFLYEDGIITPAISVPGTIEVLSVATPGLHSYWMRLARMPRPLFYVVVDVYLSGLPEAGVAILPARP